MIAQVPGSLIFRKIWTEFLDPGVVLAIAYIWEINTAVGPLCLSISLPPKCNKQANKQNNIINKNGIVVGWVKLWPVTSASNIGANLFLGEFTSDPVPLLMTRGKQWKMYLGPCHPGSRAY